MAELVIIGAGGHASVIVDILHANQKMAALRGFIDSEAKIGSTPFGLDCPILGSDVDLSKHSDCNFIIGVGTIRGDVSLRRKLFNAACAAGLKPLTLVHPSACIGRLVEVGGGTVIMAHATINPMTKVGSNSIINTGAVIEHDVKIGTDVHIAPHATILGNCSVGNKSMIGAGSVVLQGLEIGSGATIGAGSVVTRSVEEQKTAYGNPAKYI